MLSIDRLLIELLFAKLSLFARYSAGGFDEPEEDVVEADDEKELGGVVSIDLLLIELLDAASRFRTGEQDL
eukprot:2977590-Rhodomonas_salina.2